MAVSSEMLQRIMGAPGSVTGKLVAMRRTPKIGEPLVTGVWYSNFTRVKEEADRLGLPFFAMWTNGDLCGFCRRFTENILDPEFIDRMETSNGLWWLGGSMDDNEEDRRGGIGFNWCMGPDKKVNYFPFFAVHQVDDSGSPVRGFFGSGHDYDGGKKNPEGTRLIMSQFKDILSSPYLSVKSVMEKQEEQKNQDAPLRRSSGVNLDTSLHIRFNPDWDAAHIARFQASLKEHGGHCPCQNPQTPDTMCMCKAFLEQKTPGKCHCGAYEKFSV